MSTQHAKSVTKSVQLAEIPHRLAHLATAHLTTSSSLVLIASINALKELTLTIKGSNVLVA
jgi:hypothetical protein